jgi:hypothetical protein
MMKICFPNKGGKILTKAYRWIVPLVLMVTAFFAFNAYHANTQAHAAGKSTTIWLQTMDSCEQAIPGATFQFQGHHLKVLKGPGPGTKPVTVGNANGMCPLQRGNCVSVPTGCLSWTIAAPTSGTAKYKIIEKASPATYVPCTGGSVCTGGPVVITLTVSSTGIVSATARNVYPDGTVVVWPTTGAAYSATSTDPIVVHNFGLGTISCDGDGDADDHLTGSPSTHCDNDKDRP